MDIMIIKGLLFAVILVIASYIDIKTRTIPDWIHVLIMLVALIKIDLVDSLIGLVVVPLPFLIMACMKDGSIGGGDVKLVAACGFFLGVSEGLTGSIISLTVAITLNILLRIRKKEIKNSAFPFAPYLGIGMIISLLLR